MSRFTPRTLVLILTLSMCTLGWAQNSFESDELKGFTIGRGEHIINHLDQAFTVSRVIGKAAVDGNDSPAFGVLIELRGPNGSDAMVSTTTRLDGTFRLKHVRPGKYMFKAMWLGFQSVVGTIIVSATAEAHQTITIQMTPGV